jgi:hypothetical protein
MKLLRCGLCGDVFSLHLEMRSCHCGDTKGMYLEDCVSAIYYGEHAKPIGFANNSFKSALVNQPERGLGEDFKAFVIPKECETFKKVSPKV